MLDPEEHAGIFTVLVGIIVLVMVALGFSLLLDMRFKFSSGRGDIRREIEADAAILSELKSLREHRTEYLIGSAGTRKTDIRERADLQNASESLTQRAGLLREKAVGLTSSVESLESRFADYRSRYRTRTWSQAVGEKLGTVSIRGGREYRDSIITRVTDVGLEIRHEDGIARIQAPDLNQAFQDRFQWNDEERRRRLQEEDELLHGKTPVPPPAGEEAGDGLAMDPSSGESVAPIQTEETETSEADAARSVQIAELHRLLAGWSSRVARISADQSEAASRSAYGNDRSATGSLETWKSREQRLSRELIKARLELEMVKAKLTAIAPDDPVLRMMEKRSR